MNLRQRLFRLLMLHQGEGQIALFLSTIAALAGFGLSIGRASSDALFFTQYGVDHLPQMFVLIALVLIPFSLAYAAFVLFKCLNCLDLCRNTGAANGA